MHMLRACHAALQAPGGGCAGGGSGDDLAVHCFEITPLGSRLGLVQASSCMRVWLAGVVGCETKRM